MAGLSPVEKAARELIPRGLLILSGPPFFSQWEKDGYSAAILSAGSLL
jgi:hypothetical protein